MVIRKARYADIALLTAVYNRAVGQQGFDPIADLDAAITAAVAGKPLILPYDRLFGVDSAEFKIDVRIAETATQELAGFQICKTLLKDGEPFASPGSYNVATELWYVVVTPSQRRCGFGTGLIKDAVGLIRSRTRGRGGLLAYVLRDNHEMSRILKKQGFVEATWQAHAIDVWWYPPSDEVDQFADVDFQE